jgi:virulence-associated protein VapD
MAQRINVTSALHGHCLSLGVPDITNWIPRDPPPTIQVIPAELAPMEQKWFQGVEPQPGFDSDEEVEPDTIVDPRRVIPPIVSWLLRQTRDLDLTQDQSYMPSSHANVQAAYQHLYTHGFVRIQEGILYWNEQINRFAVQLTDNNNKYTIAWPEVFSLLRANYPS